MLCRLSYEIPSSLCSLGDTVRTQNLHDVDYRTMAAWFQNLHESSESVSLRSESAHGPVRRPVQIPLRSSYRRRKHFFGRAVQK